jgi:hypothetical protein
VSVLCPGPVRTNISTADRNRPERFAYLLDTDQMVQVAAYKARRRDQRPAAADPSDIADQVCEAVRTNRFYILTHPASLDVFEARARRIVDGDDPVEPSE